ncbi:unnamed protein product [Cylicocyclus nassatus]|uniref:Uncharacterized protein n=1 Tax=Cylicocyclus nassatus TaxID=53992 RepID=A0AA36HCU0_CYLNA|nr:unnamed protein product [Cylicocyclus nassatus]
MEKCPANSITKQLPVTGNLFGDYASVFDAISMIQIEAEDNAYKGKLCAMFYATIKEMEVCLDHCALVELCCHNPCINHGGWRAYDDAVSVTSSFVSRCFAK